MEKINIPGVGERSMDEVSALMGELVKNITAYLDGKMQVNRFYREYIYNKITTSVHCYEFIKLNTEGEALQDLYINNIHDLLSKFCGMKNIALPDGFITYPLGDRRIALQEKSTGKRFHIPVEDILGARQVESGVEVRYVDPTYEERILICEDPLEYIEQWVRIGRCYFKELPEAKAE